MTYDLGVFKRQQYVSPTYRAVGGTVSYYTLNGVGYTLHTFLSTGTTNFTVFSTATVDMLLVGGGSGGGTTNTSPVGLGGDAGQFVTATNVTLNIGQYAVTVGNGGGSASPGTASSIVGTVNVTYATTATGGASQTGAGAGGAGSGVQSGSGGAGLYNDYSGISTAYAGGGGSTAAAANSPGLGGVGGGGNGANTSGNNALSGTPNTGGGGGGTGGAVTLGGSGIVLIRYVTPNASNIPTTDPYFNYVSLLLSNQTLNMTVTSVPRDTVIPQIDYIAVGGGGAGGSALSNGQYELGGGGGAGGVVVGTLTNVLLSSSNTFVVTVGSGGSGVGSSSGNNGNNSSIINVNVWYINTASIVAYGGGGGGVSGGASNAAPAGTAGGNGGSGGGGGGAYASYGSGNGGLSIQSSTVDRSLGYAGGNGQTRPASVVSAYGGAGGSAGGPITNVGAPGTGTKGSPGPGYTWLNGTTYATGANSGVSSAAGTAYTGNGGGGSGTTSGSITAGGNGGYGVVIFRYSGTNVLATGGTISTVSNYIYHTFQSSGVLAAIETASTTTSTSTPLASMNYALVAGGGGGSSGANALSGAGGAGGITSGTFTITNFTGYISITVGAGGAAAVSPATQAASGINTTLTSTNYNLSSTRIAYGGGAGGIGGPGANPGTSGGSGGGSAGTTVPVYGGSATQPTSLSGGFGFSGGAAAFGPAYNGSGGGGAGGPGGDAGPAATPGTGAPGLGKYLNILNTVWATTYATGGSGAIQTSNATANTGNGGNRVSNGGSGIAMLWEAQTNPVPGIIGSPTIITTGGYRLYVFTSTGALILGTSVSNAKISDSSVNSYAIAATGNPIIGTFNPYPVNSSIYFDGSSYLSIPNSASYGTTGLGLSTSDFTIEAWVYFNSVAICRIMGHTYPLYVPQGGWAIGISATGVLSYWLNAVSGNSWTIATAELIGNVVTGQWYHVALVRIGSTFTPYLNGVAGNPTSSSSAIYGGQYSNLDIGNNTGIGQYFSGYMSNIRILKGTGLYTGPFTPATGPLPLLTNTLLLLNNDIWKDLSTYNWPILLGGSPIIKKFSPFANVGAYNKSLVSGSIYFNGTTDYINVISTSTGNAPNWTYLHDGTTDYTIEGWIYPLTTASSIALIGTADVVTTTNPGMQLYMSLGKLTWYISSGTSSISAGDTGGSIKPRGWNHIACTFTSTSKTTNLYVNGFRVATTVTTTSSFTTTSAAYPLTIGKNAANASYYFPGYMSNIRILKGSVSSNAVAIGISTSTPFEYLVVAGGGAGSTGGGGGGGGFRTGTFITTQSGIIYTITVGNGGVYNGGNGGNSSIVGSGLNLVSAGGGGGSATVGGSGGSGGGGAPATPGVGNTPSTIPTQGYDGASGSSPYGGGGGATAAGNGRNGGAGALSNIDGLGYYYSGGGGANASGSTGGNGGIGGGGAGSGNLFGSEGGGARNANSPTSFDAAVNSGGGGGSGKGGGSGIVIIRYLGAQRATGGDIITKNISGYTVHTFLSSGLFIDNSISYTIPNTPVVASSTNTNLLLNFTDAAIFDASAQTNVYTNLESRLSSTSTKFNPMSMYFDGAGSSLTLSTSTIALGPKNFTVEMWMYPVTAYSSGLAPALLDSRTTGDGAGLIRFGFNGTTMVAGPQIAWIENGTTVVTATVILNVWQHIAVVRNSGIITMYNNGTAISSTTNSTNITVPFKYVGQSYNGLFWNGYMDDLRITSAARYTTAFTPVNYKPQLK